MRNPLTVEAVTATTRCGRQGHHAAEDLYRDMTQDGYVLQA